MACTAVAELSLAKEKNEPYQLLLLDHCMPGMDGMEVAEHIKKNLGSADLTIMMLSSGNRSEDIVRCQEVGGFPLPDKIGQASGTAPGHQSQPGLGAVGR